MSSIIEGYNYDIFISYRQKDNKYDGWVTEFVENLKKELEATFKEEINIYFDINPSDYLLESYEVNESLRDKLKCLIFIPIISRTYCDTGSFAWQHEFCAFNRLSKEDKFGRDIKLANGNVASRILPVRIHDLDPEDKKLIETELGGVLRGIDFIYKEPGVNRPLRCHEEHPDNNLNNTIYRNQINKVANAIKEIITTLKKQGYKTPEASEQRNFVHPAPRKNQKNRIITGSLIALFLVIIGAFFIPKLIKPPEKIEKSIAVLPFENLSSDEEYAWFSDGITDVIISQLAKISDLRVLGRTSTLKFKDVKKSISQIGRDLKVNYIIEGTIQRQNERMRISVQLIRVMNESHLWSEIYDRNWTDIFEVQSDIALRIADALKSVLSREEEAAIQSNSTANPEAYNLYLQGRLYWYMRTEEGLQKSVEFFKNAISADSSYALAYAGLSDAYFIQGYWGWIPFKEGFIKAKELALKSLSIYAGLSEGHAALGELLIYKEWDWKGAEKELQTALKINPNYVTAHHYYSELMNILRNNSEARKHINIALQYDPYLPVLRALSMSYYYNEGRFKEALDEAQILEELDPDYGNQSYQMYRFYIYVRQNEGSKAVEALQKALKTDTATTSRVKRVYDESGINGLLKLLIDRELNKPNPGYLNLARWYSILNRKEDAIKMLNKAFENPPPSSPLINCNPDFDNIRSEPGFQALIRKMGLTEYQNPR